jgi:4-amino-4-deoxy-L-arabinose transferase-like glycosyltransferase
MKPRNVLVLVLIAIAAVIPRVWRLGRLSFWYDEVVTMRLAETSSVAGLFRLLFEIDATRAPLHPLVLQEWIALYGNSEAAGRSLSVVFGLATVALLYFLGRLAFDETTGLWSAFLGAFSPLLVYYSRETRMYALLTLITTLCWVLLLWNRRTPARWKPFAYAVCVVAMLFTHPLGLLMFGTLGLASAMDVRAFFGSWKAWLAVHLGVLIITTPWLRFYFDHEPEFLSGRLPIKFLIATPISFLGGDSVAYCGLIALIAFGLYRRRIMDVSTREWIAPACLALWLVLPPTILYAYSWVGDPIFGPARYTLFCAPAYLVLVAQALTRIPPLSRWTLGLGIACLALATMRPMIYAPPRRMDWRGYMGAISFQRPSVLGPTIMIASDGEPNPELVTARYYLDRTYSVVPFDEEELATLRKDPTREVYLIVACKLRHEVSPSLEKRLQPFVEGVKWQPVGTSRKYHLMGPRRAPLKAPSLPPFRALQRLQPPAPDPAPAPAAPAPPAPD